MDISLLILIILAVFGLGILIIGCIFVSSDSPWDESMNVGTEESTNQSE